MNPNPPEMKPEYQAIALVQGPPHGLGRECSPFFQCQVCGQKITDHQTANVITPRGEEGQRLPFFVVHKGTCDLDGATSWMDLEDFVRALVASVGLKLMDKPSRN